MGGCGCFFVRIWNVKFGMGGRLNTAIGDEDGEDAEARSIVYMLT